MSLKNLLTFSSGEIDPVLHDRVTLDRFSKGLDTARNIIISKTGSIRSRFSRAFFIQTKNVNEKVKVFCPPNSGVLTEWGVNYVRLYDFSASLIVEYATTYSEADLEEMHFVPTGPFVYVFVEGLETTRLRYEGSGAGFDPGTVVWGIPSGPSSLTVNIGGVPPTGYIVDYLVTTVFNGQETDFIEDTSGSFRIPIAVNESNQLVVEVAANTVPPENINEIRVYRRPADGGAYGFIGTSNDISDNGTNLEVRFVDFGGNADFTNQPPDSVTKLGLGGIAVQNLNSKTGVVYQQRILLGSPAGDEESILASRPGYLNNFQRDFPYLSDSALKFKSGTTGRAKVLRMIESDGLIVFTTVGVFVSVGVLTVNNIALEKKGGWIIDESIPPLVVPGGVFFVDRETNGVRHLIFNNDIASYETIEHSIFSNHIFRNRTIKSWCFQDGGTSLIIVTFNDGTFATFTYSFEHQMRAWTRHDSVYPIEQVEGSGSPDSSFFVINKDGQRYIEVSLPRDIPADTFVSNPESDKINLNAFADGIKTTSNLLNNSLVGNDLFVLAPVTPGDFEGQFNLTCGTSGVFADPGFGEVGRVYRVFDLNDKSQIDLTIVSRTDDNNVVVQPDVEYPSDQLSGVRLYETFTTITGLSHLEGESVCIYSDGYVLASPNNDKELYPTVIVTGGSLTLPAGERGAIVIVGRPIVADAKTLNISTVSQSPTVVESINVNKLYVRVYETRGLFFSNQFPEEKVGGKDGTSVADMGDMDRFLVPKGGFIGNRYREPQSRRIELTAPGTWGNQGQIAFRQVDPLHFEILSIIPDVEVLNRSNR